MLATKILWLLIRAECAEWRRRGHLPLIWWRDDDAREPSESLSRLLDISEKYGAPLSLAVIPDRDLKALAAVLQGRRGLSVIQHGCDHQDRSHGAGPSCEFDTSEAPLVIAERINESWRRLSNALEAVAVFAPPWNVLTASAREALITTPFLAVSIYGTSHSPAENLREINTHIDIMKWRPPRFRGGPAILARLWRQLRGRRIAKRWNEPIGFLTHHKNLDPDAWTFLENLLATLASRQTDFGWRSVVQLLEGPSDQP